MLDRFGLVEDGFRVFDLHRHRGEKARADALVHHVRQLVADHRPSVVLVASAPSATEAMEGAVRAACRRQGTRGVHAEIDDARRLVLGRRRGTATNALAHRLVAGFAPELGQHIAVSAVGHRARRAAWSALAVAISWLVRHRPRSAFAMAHAAAFEAPALAAEIAEADRRLHPEDP